MTTKTIDLVESVARSANRARDEDRQMARWVRVEVETSQIILGATPYEGGWCSRLDAYRRYGYVRIRLPLFVADAWWALMFVLRRGA